MFSCNECQYKTKTIYNLQKHFTTNKHISTANTSYVIQDNLLNLDKKQILFCIHCGNEYTHHSSLYRHQKK